MDNHFHLFFQTPEASFSAGMHDLNSACAARFHRGGVRLAPDVPILPQSNARDGRGLE
jgi:hypothetical protein